MKRFRTAVGVAALLVGIGLSAAPAQAAAGTASEVTTCYNSLFGGAFFCGGAYGTGPTYVMLDNGNVQEYVIGTDHAVWTYWSGPDSRGWMSLGGYLTSKVKVSNLQGTGGFCTISALGGDSRPWYRDGGRGVWSAWYTDRVSS
ncbi:hypothetical protein KCMC57_up62510 [Kitasatospora sp. CMC57]|uniref:Uncharacterized protein n=1 Tax=Kitasatospora sp. CMC57 TaxID=3231513 RepID=A0AB33K8Q2_9ACTN